MRKFLILIVSLSVLAIGATVFAADFNIRGYCRQISDVVGGSYQIEEACIQMENESKRNLSGMYIPSRIKNYCTEVASVVGGSYQIMEACVQMELDSKSRIGN